MVTLFVQQDQISRDQLREQIRETVRQAQQAAAQAAKAGADARTQGHAVVIPPVPPVPGIVQTPGTAVPFDPAHMIPPQVEPIAISFFICIAAIIIGLPLMRAIARRIDRGTPPAQSIPAEVRQNLQQLSASVDAIAIEVERISEGQRFTTKLLTERQSQAAPLNPGNQS